MIDLDFQKIEHCVRCGDSSALYRYFNLDYLLGSLGVDREVEVKGLVCPKCREEIIEKAKGRFDEKLGIKEVDQ